MESGDSISIPSIGAATKNASVGQTTHLKCECGLSPVLRTALTFQNMGKRFWGCPNYVIGKPCNFFHFLPSDEVIEGRARDLLLRLKDKQLQLQADIKRMKKENADLIKGNADLIKGNDDLMEENANLLLQNGELLQVNGVLKAECELLGKKIKHLEKKVKRSEKVCMRSKKVSIILCVFCMLIVVSAVGMLIVLQKLH